MTDSSEKTRIELLRDQFGDDIYTKTKWEGRGADWLIQWFANFVNTAEVGLSIPMTFTIGGSLISGYLISETAYFDQLASDFSGALPGAAKDAGRDLIKLLQPEVSAHEDDHPAEQFVHLKDAQVFSDGSKPITSKGALWRGKISSIEGFHLGSITVS